MKTICIKLGGSVITNKKVKNFPIKLELIRKRAVDYIRIKIIQRVVRNEILPFVNKNRVKLIIGLGVGPFGHHLIKRISELDDIKDVHQSVLLYSQIVSKEMNNEGLVTELISPFDTCYYEDDFNINNLLKTAKSIIDKGRVPLFFGDIIPTRNVIGKFGNYEILSADKSICDVALKFQAEKVIMVTDVDGLYTKNPKIHRDAKLINQVRSDENLVIPQEGMEIDVTGRIFSKIENLQRITKEGIKGQIINGLREGNLLYALNNKDIGTVFVK